MNYPCFLCCGLNLVYCCFLASISILTTIASKISIGQLR
nr:MAG TPA: hypothetical protein [Caudoviricetes sp.]